MSTPFISVGYGRGSGIPRWFQHVPLQNTWEIRLVELLPGNEDEEIYMRVHTRPGRDAPHANAIPPNLVKYIALSYTWGDPTLTVPILLNGERFLVTKNLYSALAQFRQPTGYRSLFYWIDAICINQEDVQEKSIQVQRMKQIYEGADEVYVWLGAEANDSYLAMRKLDSLNKYFRQQGPDEAAAQIMANLVDQEDTSWMFGPPSEPFDERPWRALEKLFERPWWTRVWIIQESTTLETPTYIFCGSENITTKSLYIACVVILILATKSPIYQQLKDYDIDTGKAHKLRQIVNGRFVGGRNLQTLNLLREFRPFQATDPRDKVYAIAPLAADAEQTEYLRPNYSKTVQEVYIDAVRHVVETSDYLHKLDFLGFSGKTYDSVWDKEHDQAMLQWPTWLPDWSYGGFMPRQFQKQIVKEGGIFGGDSKVLSNAVYLASSSEEKLNELFEQNPTLLMDWLVEEAAPVLMEKMELKVKGFSLGPLSHITTRSGENTQVLLEDTAYDRNIPWPVFLSDPLDVCFGPAEAKEYQHVIVADVLLYAGSAVRRGYAADWPTEMVHGLKDLEEEHTVSQSIDSAINGRRIARLGSALALVPETVKRGDEVFVLFGGQVLYVLRPVSSHYEFIGECYVHGLMDGDALQRLKSGSARIQTIRIR